MAEQRLRGLRPSDDEYQGPSWWHLSRLAEGTVDLLFLDAERVEYPNWWPHPVRVLRSGGVLAIDNVLSHADEVVPFLRLLAGDQRLLGSTVAVGKGLHVAWRRGVSQSEL
jgi:predicted O-methyltransferase YrrM